MIKHIKETDNLTMTTAVGDAGECVLDEMVSAQHCRPAAQSEVNLEYFPHHPHLPPKQLIAT